MCHGMAEGSDVISEKAVLNVKIDIVDSVIYNGKAKRGYVAINKGN
jgi:hypothetical protein